MSDTPKFSLSEEHGLGFIKDTDALVFSPGISTGGAAEIRIVKDHPHTTVIATTLDEQGLAIAKKTIEEQGLSSRINAELEDLRDAWHYPENYFDFIYSRLVLHYLSIQELGPVLSNLFLSLKPGGKIFVVVRSVKNFNVKSFETLAYDEVTHFTSYRRVGEVSAGWQRYFHTPESIRQHLEEAGFKVVQIAEHEELLYKDFMRTVPSPDPDYLIEILASKP